MILNTFIAVAVILCLLAVWIGIQHLGRAFARRHPEFGPAREEGGGCGFFCLCKGPEACPRRTTLKGVRPSLVASVKGASVKGVRPSLVGELNSSTKLGLTPSRPPCHPFQKTHPLNQESKS